MSMRQDKEFYHSSCIIDFTFIIVYFLIAAFTALRVIKYKQEYPKIPADKKSDMKYEDPQEKLAKMGSSIPVEMKDNQESQEQIGNEDQEQGQVIQFESSSVKDVNIDSLDVEDVNQQQKPNDQLPKIEQSNNPLSLYSVNQSNRDMISKKDQPDQPKDQLEQYAEQFDEFLQNYFVFFLVQVLNLSCFGTYIFSVFLTIFWFMSLLFFNKLKIFEVYQKNAELQSNSEYFHLFFIGIMFLNFFGI